MPLIIKRLKDEALMVPKDSDIDTIKDTIKLVLLLVVKDDKILLSLGIETIGVDFVFRGLELVSWILMLTYINRPRAGECPQH